MLIAGLDLAAEPKGTALAVLDWSAGSAKLARLETSISDQDIVDIAPGLAKLGIDCALGWPVEFVDFLKNFGVEHLGDVTFAGDIDWRRMLAYRETDREVRRVTGRWPLSVSTDRLAMTALRCAGLLSKLHHSGVEIDRSGAGKVVEIYPAASLRIWGFQTAGYRSSQAVRVQLVEQLNAKAEWLDLGGFEKLMTESCDAFDAVIAALAAASARLGSSTRAPADKVQLAKIEGWINLPTSKLETLALAN